MFQYIFNLCLCDGVFESDDTAPASFIKSGGHDFFLVFEIRYYGSSFVLTLCYLENNIPMSNRIRGLVGKDGGGELLELGEEVVIDFEGLPLAVNKVGVVEYHEALLESDTGLYQRLVIRGSDSMEVGLGLSEGLILFGIFLGD